jgi:proteasome accessory factor B
MSRKVERLLDLVNFLLDTRRPVSREEIFQAFPDDYGEAGAAAERKFERDKAELLELGIPLKYLPEDEFSEGGYFIDREQYALPKLDLGPEELAMLFLAGSSALGQEGCPFSRDLVLALNKIALAAEKGQEVPPPAGWWPKLSADPLLAVRRERLEKLQRAVAQRKKVFLTYHSWWSQEQSRRWVDPYGLACRGGQWYLVGYCHLRGAVRIFHVDRISALEVNPEQPSRPDFDPPEDLDLRGYLARHPWQIKVHPPEEVEIEAREPVYDLLARELADALDRKEHHRGGGRLLLQATNLEGLLPTILWYRHWVMVVRPQKLVEQVRAALKRLCGQEPR